ncbi:hypothetical protein SAMN02745671_01653 [Anaerovibrio lipolyticus DSM 3074]|uniref:Uncharacterized protein n=1 Tax=Anaerovibrio lipolyticus DSM 3074 TaxID=1120997 RepID=A0A1M6DYL8_9FIRM|nr:hypothetical protein [Anaerovibrio lipolyticus]SHI78249.1 hypothetical protein SAMN02745671_01653 [Anaerovibrio lipolyticus DSM 3074]
MGERFFVAGCVFSEGEPELSRKVQAYVKDRFSLPVIRCCVAKYKVQEFEERMPEWYRDEWKSVKHYEDFPSGSTMVSICHNCSAIFEERHPEIQRQSIWELILEDDSFPYPNYHGESMTVQDCWRSKENCAEQDAVRELMRRMNINIVELAENREHTKFCGYSLYQPQPPRNAKLAPKRFVDGAKGLFAEHTEEEKKRLMVEHCSQISTDKVVAYCHYCIRGLNLGGKQGIHLARLLFEPENVLD